MNKNISCLSAFRGDAFVLFQGTHVVLRTRPPHRLGGARSLAPLARGPTRPGASCDGHANVKLGSLAALVEHHALVPLGSLNTYS